MRDVTASNVALLTRMAPAVPLTSNPFGPATSSRIAVARGGMLIAIDFVATAFAVLPAWKYSSSAAAGVSYDGLNTRASVTNTVPTPVVRPATAMSYSFAGTSAPRISPPGKAVECRFT